MNPYVDVVYHKRVSEPDYVSIGYVKDVLAMIDQSPNAQEYTFQYQKFDFEGLCNIAYTQIVHTREIDLVQRLLRVMGNRRVPIDIRTVELIGNILAYCMQHIYKHDSITFMYAFDVLYFAMYDERISDFLPSNQKGKSFVAFSQTIFDVAKTSVNKGRIQTSDGVPFGRLIGDILRFVLLFVNAQLFSKIDPALLMKDVDAARITESYNMLEDVDSNPKTERIFKEVQTILNTLEDLNGRHRDESEIRDFLKRWYVLSKESPWGTFDIGGPHVIKNVCRRLQRVVVDLKSKDPLLYKYHVLEERLRQIIVS